jgi:hypothetical protein
MIRLGKVFLADRWVIQAGWGRFGVTYLFPWSWPHEWSNYLWAHYPRDTEGWLLRIAGLEVFWRWD